MDGINQVVLIDPAFEQFKDWIASRGWRLFRMPAEVEDGIPTWGIDPLGR